VVCCAVLCREDPSAFAEDDDLEQEEPSSSSSSESEGEEGEEGELVDKRAGVLTQWLHWDCGWGVMMKSCSWVRDRALLCMGFGTGACVQLRIQRRCHTHQCAAAASGRFYHILTRVWACLGLSPGTTQISSSVCNTLPLVCGLSL
jgi:hypothetical protein